MVMKAEDPGGAIRKHKKFPYRSQKYQTLSFEILILNQDLETYILKILVSAILLRSLTFFENFHAYCVFGYEFGEID